MPLLKPVLIDLLEELPSSSTGLGATEMRMLELIARGYSLTNALFHLYQLRQTRIFGEWEVRLLARWACVWPDDRPWQASTRNCVRSTAKICETGTRLTCAAGCRSPNSARPFLRHKEDFSRHNPIDRWWGGTHLTNDNLWRWNPMLVEP